MKNRLSATLLASAIAITGTFEGLRLYAYQDSAGVWTACYGETLGIAPGDRFNKAQCDRQFAASLKRHNQPFTELAQPLPNHVHLAVLDLSYNIGSHAMRRSTLYRHLQRQEYPQACQQIMRWRYITVDGVKRDCRDPRWQCSGIVKRRQLTTDLCLGRIDLSQALTALGQPSSPDHATLAQNSTQSTKANP